MQEEKSAAQHFSIICGMFQKALEDMGIISYLFQISYTGISQTFLTLSYFPNKISI